MTPHHRPDVLGILRGATGHSIIATDTDGLITFFNAGAERLLGYAADEVVGRTTPALIHDADEVVARAAELGLEPGFEVFVHAARRGEEEIRDWTYVRRDGGRVPVRLTVTAIRGEDGTLEAFLGIAHDLVREREAVAEATVVRSQQETLLHQLPDTSVAVVDASFRLVSLTSPTLPEEATVGLPLAELLGDAWWEEHRHYYVRALAGEMVQFTTESPLRAATLEVDLAPVTGAGGERRILAVSRDVTERRAADEAVRRADRRVRRAFEAAPNGVALLDGDERFLQVNKALCRLVGRSSVELTGMPLSALVTSDSDVAASRLLDPELAGARHDLQLRRPDGSRIWVALHASPVRDDPGSPERFIVHVSDVTDVMRAQEAIVDAAARDRDALARLTELDRLKTEFVSTVSHELRTPLTSMTGYLELLLEQTGDELSDVQRQMISVVERNSTRLLALIEDLLTLSRVESGKLRLQQEEIDVARLLADVHEAVLPLLSNRHLAIDVSVGAGVDTLRGDASQVERVLFNLVSNAVKFTPDGGRIALEAERAGEAVRLRVADTGMGMDSRELEKLFTRFFRSATATKGAIQGTGLGLVITKSIVEQHGGVIDVDSAPGVGTTFVVTIPVAAGQAPDAETSGCPEQRYGSAPYEPEERVRA